MTRNYRANNDSDLVQCGFTEYCLSAIECEHGKPHQRRDFCRLMRCQQEEIVTKCMDDAEYEEYTK